LSRSSSGGRPRASTRSACSINLRISSADRPCAVPIWEISLTSCGGNAHVAPCPEKTEPASHKATSGVRDTWKVMLIGLANNQYPTDLSKTVIDEVIRRRRCFPFPPVNDVHEAVFTGRQRKGRRPGPIGILRLHGVCSRRPAIKIPRDRNRIRAGCRQGELDRPSGRWRLGRLEARIENK